MSLIALTQGKYAIVDDEDHEALSRFKWQYHAFYGYAMRSTPKINGKRKTVYMHCEIMAHEDGQEVDHINRNTLDNRKSNLRPCSHGQNKQNTERYKNNKSGFKGVYWSNRRRKWGAVGYVNKRQKALGFFSNIIDAAKAYDDFAIENFGDFAVTNFQITVNQKGV